MKKSTPFLIGLGIIVFLLILSSMYTVDQREQALVLRFNAADRVENAWGQDPDAGLKYRVPVIEKVVKLDRRNLEIDLEPVELLASDQERLVVDAFVRYRIVDPVQFYEAVRNEQGAKLKLQSIMDSTLRDTLGRVDTQAIIAERRAELMDQIQVTTNNFAKRQRLGIEVIDVRIVRADLPQENAEKVFARMVSQRRQEASRERAEGEERALEIRATADKEVTIIKATAQEQAEIIRGQADAERNAIFAAAYEKDPEFFKFYRSMEAYRKGLKDGTTYVISPDNDFLSYLDDQRGGGRR